MDVASFTIGVGAEGALCQDAIPCFLSNPN